MGDFTRGFEEGYGGKFDLAVWLGSTLGFLARTAVSTVVVVLTARALGVPI